MNVDFFLKFNEFRLDSNAGAEDFTDSFNYKLTSCVVIFFVTVVGIREYVFTPILCWVPAEWTNAWAEYAENYCWVQETYMSRIDEGPPYNETVRWERQLCYYQWVPFMLTFQCFCFFFPHLLWRMYCERGETSISEMVQYASQANGMNEEKREKLLDHVSNQFYRIMKPHAARHGRLGPVVKTRKYLTSFFPFYLFSKRSGNRLFVAYMLMKVAYLINAVSQIFLMKAFLQMNSFWFGVQVFWDITHHRPWELSGAFPRVTWCDVRTRDMANDEVHTFMCVLPINMMNEKLYIFLWFWVFAALALTTWSLGQWIWYITSSEMRLSTASRYHQILACQDDKSRGNEKSVKVRKSGKDGDKEPLLGDSDDEEKKKLLDCFAEKFLRIDGIFLLLMIGRHASIVATSEVMQRVFQLYLDDRERNKKLYESMKSKQEPDPSTDTNAVPNGSLLPPSSPKRPLEKPAPPPRPANMLKTRQAPGNGENGRMQPVNV